MTNSKQSGHVILAIVVISALYLTWTAISSSQCISTGITFQTRTTWAPFSGCEVPDDYKKPWSAITAK